MKLNLPMKKHAIFKKQRISKVSIQLRERNQQLLDVLKKYEIISPVNKEQLSTANTFTNPVIILRKGESLKIVLDAQYLNSMIDESKCNWPIEAVDVALTRINGRIFTTADLNSAYNQIPLDEQSMRYTQFTIGNEQYCFKRLFYGWTRSVCIDINALSLSFNQERDGNHICRRHFHSNQFIPTNV